VDSLYRLGSETGLWKGGICHSEKINEEMVWAKSLHTGNREESLAGIKGENVWPF
jgi:hypothetical protein